MAGSIKGITIEFRGDTTKLSSALRQVDKETRSIDKQLRQVNQALKFNPTSVELWRQKQQLLTQKINETKDKLQLLKQQQKAMDASGVDKQSAEYMNLRREIIETESKLKAFKGQLRQVGNVNLKALSMQFKEIGSKLKNVGQTMTTKVTAPIVAGYTAASKYASDYEENLNKLDVAFGSNSQTVKDWANNARTEFGLSKVQATEAASAFGALGKGIGLSEKEAADMSTTLTGLSADLGSYFNVGVDESAKALEGIFTGESEALKKFGVVMTDTNLKQFAEDQGLVYNEMTQAEKTMLRYQYVLDKTKDAQGDFSRTNDGTANSLKIFQASLQDLATAIGTNLLPIITPIIQKITEIINKFNELSPQAQKIVTIVGLVIAAVGPVLVILGTLASSIGSILGLVGTVGPVIAGVAGPIAIVIGVIALLITIGVALYKNWDEIKAKAIEIQKKIVAAWQGLKNRVQALVTALVTAVTSRWNSMKAKVVSTVNGLRSWLSGAWQGIKSTASSVWNSIKEAITSPIRSAKETVSGIIDTIRGFFPINIGKILSNLSLPHFSLSWSSKDFGPLGTLRYPTGFNVSWYAKGGIFDSPTIAGIGEAGPEAVVPLNEFWNKLDRIGENAGATYNFYITGDDPQAIAAEVKKILINDVNRKRMAWQ